MFHTVGVQVLLLTTRHLSPSKQLKGPKYSTTDYLRFRDESQIIVSSRYLLLGYLDLDP